MLFMGCNDNNRAEDPLADSGRTQRTETLLTNLKQLGDSSVYLFGHHDDTVYGIGWEADYGNDSTIHQRSDVKSVCNDYPALLSFDLGHIELGDERNLDRHPISYVLVWRNAHNRPNHYFAPYPGQQSTSDFIRFYNAKQSLFLSDINGLYLGL